MPEAPLKPDLGLLKVALLFAVIYAVLQTALAALVQAGLLDWLMEFTAWSTGACTNLTGVPASVVGNEVALQTRILRIDPACTALPIMIVYVSLVLAYPLGAARKFLGLIVGLAAISVANGVRLLTVAQLSGRLEDPAFFFVHDYLFMIAMVGIVIVVWALYLASARSDAARRDAASK